MWRNKNDGYITNEKSGKVIAVSGGLDNENRNIVVEARNGKIHQKWKVVYLDKAEKTEVKGLNEEFGFHINRPFYIVSELPFNRVAEMLGGTNMVLKRWRNNQRQQQFWFDEKTKTVRNNYWKNYAIEI
jgi:hypothetical protein